MCITTDGGVTKFAFTEATGPLFILSLASTAAQLYGQKQAADASYRFQEQQAAKQRQIANDAARTQYMGLIQRQSQAREAAAQDVQDTMAKTMKANAAARVAAAAGGVTGLSVSEGADQFGRQFSDYTARRMGNLNWEEAQILSSMKGVESQQAGRVAASVGDPIAQPNYLAGILDVAAGYYDAQAFYGTN